MLDFIILVINKFFVMNSDHFKHSPEYDYPAIELDMTSFVEHLSDEYICEEAEIRDDSVRTNPKIIECKTEDYIDLGEISSVSGLELDEKGESLV